MLTGGGYRKHLTEIHRRLALARKTIIARLAGLGITPLIVPRGGFYLWCQFPDGIDTGEIAQRAMADNVILAPGNVFSPSQSARGFMRFNVAQMADQRVYASLAKALGRA